MGSIINNDFFNNCIGYPCYKYILRNMPDLSGLPVFEKTVLSTLLNDGKSIDESMRTLFALNTYLTPAHKIFGANFLEYRGEIIDERDFPELILKDRDVKTYTDCTAYYKSVHKKCGCCKLCPRSVMYCNADIEYEYAILKYILKSKSNFEDITSYIESSGFIFQGCDDIASDLLIANAYVLPVNDYFYQCILLHPDVLFYKNSNYNTILFMDFSRKLKEKGRVPSSVTEMEKWSIVVTDKQLCRIQDAPDLSKEEITAFIDKAVISHKLRLEEIEKWKQAVSARDTSLFSTYIKPPYGKEKVKSKKNVVRISSVGTVIEDKDEDTIESGPEFTLSAPTVSEVSVAVTNIVESVAGPVNDIQPDIDVSIEPEVTELALCAELEISDPSNDGIVIDAIDDCSKDLSADYSDALDDYPVNVDVSEEVCDCEEQEVVDEVYSLQLPSVLKDTNVELFLCDKDIAGEGDCDTDCLSFREIEYTSLIKPEPILLYSADEEDFNDFRCIWLNNNTVLLSMLERFIIADKAVHVEVVDTPSGYNLILYVKRKRAFFYTDLKDDVVNGVISRLFARATIHKMCYLPFMLYSFCGLNNIKIKGLFSLASKERSRKGNSKITGIEELMLSYDFSAKKLYVSALEENKHPLLASMKYYAAITRKQSEDVSVFDLGYFNKLCCFDEVLGCSYLRSQYLRDEGVLFNLSAERITFCNNSYYENKHKVIKDGYFAKYELLGECPYKEKIIVDVLCKMANAGRFRQFPLYLSELNKSSVVLFIGKECFSYLDTLLSTEFLSYARKLGIKDFSISVDYELVLA